MPDPIPVYSTPGVIYTFLSETVYGFTGSNQTWLVPSYPGDGSWLVIEISGRGGRGAVCPTLESNYHRQWFTFARQLEIIAEVDPIWVTLLDVIVGGDGFGATGGWPDGGNGGDGHGSSTAGFGGGGASEVLGVGHGSLWDAPGTGGGSGQPGIGFNPTVLHWNANIGGYENTPVEIPGIRGVPGGSDLPGGTYLDGGWWQGALWPHDFAQGSLYETHTDLLSVHGSAGSGGQGGDGGDSVADLFGEGVGGGGGGGGGTVNAGGQGGGGTDYDPDNPPDLDDSYAQTWPRGIVPLYKDVSIGGWSDYNDYNLSDPTYPAGAGTGTPRKAYPEAVGFQYGFGGGGDGGTTDSLRQGGFTSPNGEITIRAWWARDDTSGPQPFIGIIGPAA